MELQDRQLITLFPSCLFTGRVGEIRGRIRKITAVALARKLLVALWRYVTTGLVPEGARLKPGAT